MPVPGVPTLSGSRVTITVHPDAAAFLAASLAFRARDPVLTNIIGSVAAGVVAGRRYERETWLTVHDRTAQDRTDEVVGLAIRTAPWNLLVSPMDTDAAHALGAFLSTRDPDLPGITGPRPVVEAVLPALNPPGVPRTVMVDVARVLEELRPPPPVPGSARRATHDDRALLLGWHRSFGAEADLPAHGLEESVDAGIEHGSWWLWAVGGDPVAMAGHAPPVDTPGGTVTRIGPVFTPPEQRRRGYGTAITAHVALHLRQSGSSVMLFADAGNADTNRLYGRLGFRAKAEIVEVVLEQ